MRYYDEEPDAEAWEGWQSSGEIDASTLAPEQRSIQQEAEE